MPQKKERDPRSIYVFTEKFTEGEWHEFRVLKMMQIPGEENYYVLESKAGNRLLLPSKFYQTYAISPGDKIQCHIDKINCSGKIYLEPEHPFYKAGRKYIFKLKDKHEFTDRKDRIQTYYALTGPDDMRVQAMFIGISEKSYPVHISAILVAIRKGILILNEIEVINNC